MKFAKKIFFNSVPNHLEELEKTMKKILRSRKSVDEKVKLYNQALNVPEERSQADDVVEKFSEKIVHHTSAKKIKRPRVSNTPLAPAKKVKSISVLETSKPPLPSLDETLESMDYMEEIQHTPREANIRPATFNPILTDSFVELYNGQNYTKNPSEGTRAKQDKPWVNDQKFFPTQKA